MHEPRSQTKFLLVELRSYEVGRQLERDIHEPVCASLSECAVGRWQVHVFVSDSFACSDFFVIVILVVVN
jgi:hypothetical protein